jgi:predicted enzyme related to lactoylglutathione lyase
MQLLNWFEIPVKDFHRGMKFYSQVFRHIRFDIMEFNGISHAVFRPTSEDKAFHMTGALVEHSEKAEHHNGPVLFFTISEGMGSVLERVELCGGTIVQNKKLIKNALEDGRVIIPKTLIDGNVGYFSHFKDTEGNRIGLYSNS